MKWLSGSASPADFRRKAVASLKNVPNARKRDLLRKSDAHSEVHEFLKGE
jgi:hypothetical protein